MEKVKESTLKYFGVNIWTRYYAHFAGDCVHPLMSRWLCTPFGERNSRIFGGQASTSDTLFASWIEWSVTGYYLALVVLRLVDHCCSSTSASSLRTASCSCLCFVLFFLDCTSEFLNFCLCLCLLRYPPSSSL